MPIVIVPVALLAFCAGIMLIGTLLYLYVFSFTGARLYLATAIIGALGILYTGTDMLVVVSSILGMDRLGMQIHRIEALSVTFYMFALPFVFHHLLELTPFLKRINRLVYTAGMTIAIIIIFWAFISPDEFLRFSKNPGMVPTAWNSGRATPGILYKLRDLVIILLSIYSIALMIVEISLTKKTRHVILFLAGLVIGIASGVIDLLFAVKEMNTGLFSIRVFPFFCLGVTVFTVMAMISTMKLFIDQSRTLERARKNEYLELIAGGIAHDFNNILTGVLANASLARETTPKSEKNYSLLHEIEKAALRAKDLSGQLLTFSKGGIIVKTLAPMADLIRDTVRFSLAGSNIEVNYAVAPDLLNAAVDVGKISQVLQNLAINAKQAMSTGGRLDVAAENVTISNGTPDLPAGTYIRIRFSDSGTGIPEKFLHTIFEPYFTTKPGGEGLGLAISYSIVKKHGGLLEASSRINEGSTFTVHLPSTDEQVAASVDAPAPPADLSGRVLLMDDEELILKIGEKLLKHFGFTPVCVTRGEDAINEFCRARDTGHPFKFIIMDLTIPCGMGGIEAVKRVKEIDPGAKVIVSSGYAQDLTLAEYSRFGFDGAIIKPYTLEEFRSAIELICS